MRVSDPIQSDDVLSKNRKELTTKTVGISFVTLVCVVALAAPSAAMSVGFVVTDPGTLFLLGAALVSVGVWTRRLFFPTRRNTKREG